jgi:hypothetical protein
LTSLIAGTPAASLADLQFEPLARAWSRRYVRGACELDEMEAGLDRAIRGEAVDDLWLVADETMLARFQEPIRDHLKAPTVFVE